MSKTAFIGIDLGTTVLKVCVFDSRTGAILGHDSHRLKIQSFSGGGYEIQLKSIDRAFKTALTNAIAASKNGWKRIEGIGLASQAGSSIIADRRTGKPLTPMILWNDARSNLQTIHLSNSVPVKVWRQYLLCDTAPAGLGRLIWLREKYPELFHEHHIHIGAGEYLFYKLTGVWKQDAGNAVQMGSYNAAKQKLFPKLFNLIDVPLSFVAPLRVSHETERLSKSGADFTGLPEGIPVAGPYFDQESCYLASTGAADNPLQISLGTAWVGNFIIPTNMKGVSPTQIVVRSPLDDGDLIVQPVLTGNHSWEWGLRNLISPNIKSALNIAAKIFEQSTIPTSSVYVLPWLSHQNPFSLESYGGGSIVGLSDQTTREDLLRALMNGMTFELARVFQTVKDSKCIDCIVLGGGTCKSIYFCSMIASLFSPLPIYRQVDEDLSTARGSVYCFNRSIGQSQAHPMVLPYQNFNDTVHKAYTHYCNLFNSIYGSFSIGSAYRIVRKPA